MLEIQTNPKITYEMMIKATKKSKKTIGKSVKRLIELGLIERYGSNKYGYWIVNEHMNDGRNDGRNEERNEERKLTELELIILTEIRKNPKITMKNMIKTTNKSRPTIERTINKLISLGRIERIGSTKAGYWHLKYNLNDQRND